MAKKIEINENWEPVEVEDLDNLFVVIFKHGSFDQGYVEAFDTDDILMQSAYDSLSSQYAETDCDDLTKIYLIKVPNTDQTTNLCANGLFNGNCYDPHVIEAVKDLYNRADVEQLACWEGCGLTEAKKKKKYPAYASSLTYTTGDPDLNIKHFNKMMGTAGLGSDPHPHLVVGDTLPNSAQTIANLGSGESSGGDSLGGEASGGEGGSMGESLTEAKEENLEEKVREIVKGFFGEDKSRMSILEYDDGWDGFVEKFDEEEIDFGKFIYNDLTDEEIAEGRPVITFLLSGGLNGSGSWVDYLGDISKLFKEFEDKLKLHAIVYKIETDILDDVWTAEVLLYIDRDEVKESLNEDLIVIDKKDAKEYLNEIKSQIENAKDWRVRKNLLTLMNIYLFQTIYEADHQEETGCDINKEEWDEYSEWHTEQGEKLVDEHPELKAEEEAREAELEDSVEDSSSEEAEQEEPKKESLTEGCWGMPYTLEGANKLKNLMARPVDAFEVGDHPTNRNDELGIGDDTLFDNISKFRKEKGYGTEASDDVRKVIQDFIKDEVLPNWDGYSYSQPEGDSEGHTWENGVKEVFQEIAEMDLSDKADEIRKNAEEHNAKDFPPEEVEDEAPGKEEQPMEEQLNEAHLDYPTQLAKMKALENGTRGFNAASASDEKLEYNWKLCKNEGLNYAQSIMEQEMLRRGGRLADLVMKSRKTKIKITDYEYILDPGYINSAAVNTVWHSKDKPQELINYYGSAINEILMVLVIALLMGEKGLADAVKDHILNKFTITLQELKDFLNKGFANKAFVANLKQTIKTTCTESLEEDTAYSHKMGDKFEVPPQIKLLDQKQVEDFIKELAPEELFRVGYATPLYFYSEIDDNFALVKATEMEGYTGLDYRDAVADQTVADHGARVANAQRQIDTYQDGASGYRLNDQGERFSTNYRMTNKLALNPDKSNEYVEYEKDENGKDKLDDKGERIVKTKIDMNKILFYPRVGSVPITHYYIDLHDEKGFRPIKREVLAETIYKFLEQLALARDAGISKTDLMWLQKKGYGKNVKKDAKSAVDAFYAANPGNIPIWAYRKAEEAGIPVEEYVKEHRFSPRWTMSDLTKKIKNWTDADARTVIAQDASTVSGQELAAVKGMDRSVKQLEDKPQVRALYSNQVYFLDGKPGKLGNMLTEGLEEEVELDEAKRYVKRYYVRPQNIFCSNKEDILQALLRVGDENCSIYSLKNLPDHNDVHLLKPSDIIYYYDDHVLYDKNHVQVMDYDLFVKHEEDRKKVANVDAMSDAAFADEYDDRITDDDLKDKEVIANYKAINAGEFKEDLDLTEAVEFKDIEEKKKFNKEWLPRFAEILNGKRMWWGHRDSPASYSRSGITVEKVFVGVNTGNLFIKTTEGKTIDFIDKVKNYGEKKLHLEAEDEFATIDLIDLIDEYKLAYNNGAKIANGDIRSLEYAEEKFDNQVEAGKEFVKDTTPDLKEWLAQNVTSIKFTLPNLELVPANQKRLINKINMVHEMLEKQYPGITSSSHFAWENKTVENAVFSFWGLTGFSYFKVPYIEFPEELKEIIINAKARSKARGQANITDAKPTDKVINNIYVCHAILDLFDNDYTFSDKVEKEIENPFEQEFDNVDAYGDKVESLAEAKEEEKCCICGEPINGYGNNPAPYKDEGRCCDACNLKFVIPARLAALGNKEEE